MLRSWRHADFWRQYKGERTSPDESSLRFETFLIGKMPTRLFACSSARAAPERGLPVPVLVPLVHASGSPPFLDSRFPTKSLWNRMTFPLFSPHAST